jgi:hypothetical protein
MRVFLLICLMAFSTSAKAQNNLEWFGKQIPDDAANLFLRRGLDLIHLERCGQKNCVPASDDEKKKPPISIVDSRAAMAHAMMGAWAELCGLDQRRAYLPMMAFGYKVMKFNERQMALMSTIYRDFQAKQLSVYRKVTKDKGGCPEDVKAKFDKMLPKMALPD